MTLNDICLYCKEYYPSHSYPEHFTYDYRFDTMEEGEKIECKCSKCNYIFDVELEIEKELVSYKKLQPEEEPKEYKGDIEGQLLFWHEDKKSMAK